MSAAAEGAGTRGDYTVTSRVLRIGGVAGLVGIAATLVSVLLLKMIAFFTNLFLFARVSLEAASPTDHRLGALVILAPVVGALIVGAMARWGSEKIRGHGIPEAMEAILLHGSRIQPKVALLKPISAAISIGSGGPFGAEGPIIMTGGAIGSLVAQTLHLTAAERKTLLVAGAAAGMTAIFGTPVASVLLAVELLLFEWKPRSLIPVIIAVCTAAGLRPELIGSAQLFPLPAALPETNVPAIIGCIVSGVIAGIASHLLTRTMYGIEDGFERLPVHWAWWPAIGAVLVGIGGWLDPRVLGVGYANIAALLGGAMVGREIVKLLVLKAGVWLVALGSGTSGGVLAPLLTIGAALGGLEASVLPAEGVGFWPLVSMGAIFGATMRCPLTAVVFGLELTRDVESLLPLLVAVGAAHLVTSISLSRSILTEKIARRGVHVSHEYAIDPLETMLVADVMAPLQTVVTAETTVAEARHTDPNQRLIPVVEHGRLVGVVTHGDLAEADPAARVDTIVRVPVTAFDDDILRVVVTRMADARRTTLPVVARSAPGRLVGVITLEHMLKARTRALLEEEHRERPIAIPFTRRAG